MPWEDRNNLQCVRNFKIRYLPFLQEVGSQGNAEESGRTGGRFINMWLRKSFTLKMTNAAICKGYFKWQLHRGRIFSKRQPKGLNILFPIKEVSRENMFHMTQHETTFNELNLSSSFLLSQYLLSTINKERWGCCVQPKITGNKLCNELKRSLL